MSWSLPDRSHRAGSAAHFEGREIQARDMHRACEKDASVKPAEPSEFAGARRQQNPHCLIKSGLGRDGIGESIAPRCAPTTATAPPQQQLPARTHVGADQAATLWPGEPIAPRCAPTTATARPYPCGSGLGRDAFAHPVAAKSAPTKASRTAQKSPASAGLFNHRQEIGWNSARSLLRRALGRLARSSASARRST